MQIDNAKLVYFFLQCTVNPDSLAMSLSSVNVRMKTKSMSRSALQDQNKCILVSNVAQTSTEITPFYLDNVRYVFPYHKYQPFNYLTPDIIMLASV